MSGSNSDEDCTYAPDVPAQGRQAGHVHLSKHRASPRLSDAASSPPTKRTKIDPSAPLLQGGSQLGKQGRAKDFVAGIHPLVLWASHYYAALIITEDAFPDAVTQARWAAEAWNAACQQVGEKYKMDTRIKQAVSECFLFISLSDLRFRLTVEVGPVEKSSRRLRTASTFTLKGSEMVILRP
jgi:hypothetical protein